MSKEQEWREEWKEHYLFTPNGKLSGMDDIANWWINLIHKEKEALLKNVGMLRQWLNEDRIDDHNKMVTNEELMTFL